MAQRSLLVALAAVLFAGGCIVAAVGAGAGGGIYFTERGVESIVPAPLDRAAAATQRAFTELKIRQTKATSEQPENGSEKREVDGTGNDRDVTVTLKTEGKNSTRIQVVAKTSAVTWDKGFARTILGKIVAYSR